MDYKDALSTLTMSSKTTKMLGVGIAAIAFLLVTIPVFHSGVLYADSGDNDNGGDHGDHNNNCDNGDHNNNCDNGDHNNNCDNGDHNNDNHDSDNE